MFQVTRRKGDVVYVGDIRLTVVAVGERNSLLSAVDKAGLEQTSVLRPGLPLQLANGASIALLGFVRRARGDAVELGISAPPSVPIWRDGPAPSDDPEDSAYSSSGASLGSVEIERRAGQVFVVETPRGRLRIAVTKVTFGGAVDFEVALESGAPQARRARQGDPLAIEVTGRGLVRVEVLRNVGSSKVMLAVQAPRSWPIARAELLEGD
jgi:sRNA-binding carbon storage regulator CsrA